MKVYAMGSACYWHAQATGQPRIKVGEGVSFKVTLERAQLLGCEELCACAYWITETF